MSCKADCSLKVCLCGEAYKELTVSELEKIYSLIGLQILKKSAPDPELVKRDEIALTLLQIRREINEDHPVFNVYNHAVECDNKRPTELLQMINGRSNVYFHGFCDKQDDLAYSKGTIVVSEGIYNVNAYGTPAILFIWLPESSSRSPNKLYKGLIVEINDNDRMIDAYAKYTKKAPSI